MVKRASHSTNDTRQSRKLMDELQRVQRKLDETEQLYKRAIADYRNLEGRVEKERSEMLFLAHELMVQKLLPIADTLEQVVTAAPDTERETSWFAGVAMVLGQVQTMLLQARLVEIDALGHPFDPNVHEAIDTTVGQPDTVVKVLTKGYRIGDRVVRPARVVVGKGD